MIGAAVAAAVLILLPLVDDYANVFAGLAGALVGAACGAVAAFSRRERHARLPRLLGVDKFITITPDLHRYSVEHSSFRDELCLRSSAAGETWATSRPCRSPPSRPP